MAFEIITALPTPMLDNKVDYISLDRLVDQQLDSGITQLVALGSTAETHLLTPLEKWKVAARIRQRTQDKCKLIVAVGSSNTATTIKDAIKATEYGADGLLVVTPYYVGFTQQGLIEQFRQLRNCTNLPIILYNVPSRTGNTLTAQLIAQLHQLHYIDAIKQSDSNIKLTKNIIQLAPTLDIYCGNDNQIVDYYRLNCKGAISVLSNIAPQLVSSALTNKKHSKVLSDICNAMTYTNPVCIKHMAKHMQIIDSAEVRLPLTTIVDSDSLLTDTLTKYQQYLL